MLASDFTVKRVCRVIGINRSGFYKWRRRRMTPTERQKRRLEDIELFREYHGMYPTHGYRWLRAKIELDLGIRYSDNYAQRVCRYAGIRSISKRFKKYKSSDRWKTYPNLLFADLSITSPLQVVVSDMTAFKVGTAYYELTLYMDLFNNEIAAYALSEKRGDRQTYIDGLDGIIGRKKASGDLTTVLHTDQGTVYASKNFNELAQLNGILHSMSRAGTPTDNGWMEAVNGWLKEELFNDFHIKESDDVRKSVEEYIFFFNNERPAYALDYLTPRQFKEKYYGTVSTFC
ncbi:MAG: IS3 family transposase [Spirochaetia bacterium]|nr:IS3 family transposase [Spirochaetia bacterium]